MKKTKKKVFKWVLSVDLEGGDGADYFPINGRNWKSNQANIDANFSQLLYCCDPPPKVEVIGLTKKEWEKAVKVGRQRA
jgi:hypothetical protein